MGHAGPRSLGLALLIITSLLLVPVGAASEGTCTDSPESCPDADPSEVTATVESVQDPASSPVELVLGELDEVVGALGSARGATEGACRQAAGSSGTFGDLDTSQDAGARPADAMRIETEAEIETSWLMFCPDGILQRDVDFYAFEVEEGDVVSATVTEGTCKLLLPGQVLPNNRMGDLEAPNHCVVPRTVETSGTAYLRVWSAEAFVPGNTAPRPYGVAVSTSHARMGPSQEGTLRTHEIVVEAAEGGQGSQREAWTDPATGHRGSHSRQRIEGGSAAAPPSEPSWSIGLPLVVALLGALWLYRRLTRDEALDNDIRSAILDLVEEEPGITPTEIAGELDIATNTVIYHARMLTEMDYLTTDRTGQGTRYFVAGACDRRAAAVMAMLRQRGKRDVLVAAHREPGSSISELARRLDRHRSTIKHHVDDLVEAGVLVAEKDGNGRHVAVPEPLRDLDVWDEVAG